MAKVARRAALLSSLGAGLEYYDFIIYGMMAEQLGTLFFAGEDLWLSQIKAFAIFAVGYLIRPFGGILFGLIGDTFGRKKTFLSVMLLMAVSTMLIGLLPTTSQIGVWAPCMLVLLRMIQGLSFGAELPGAITVVCEYAEKQKQSLYSSFVISSIAMGSMLASFVLFLLTKNMAREQILDWGWRIPFLLGGLLAIVNYFIRKHLQETPEFSRLQNERPRNSLKEPLVHLAQKYYCEVLLGIGMTWFVASLIIFSLYLPTYLTEHFRYSVSDVYQAMTWGMIWSALFMPIAGRIADSFSKTKILLATCLGFCCGAFALFNMLHQQSSAILILFMVLYQTVIAFLMVSYFPLLATVFPTEVRYTGIAACYNISYSIMGCVPIVITVLIKFTESSATAIWFLIGGGVVSAFSVLLLALRLRAKVPSLEQSV